MAWSRWLGDAVTYNVAPLSRYTNEPYIVPSTRRGHLLLFYKYYIVYYNVYSYYCGVFSEKYVYTKFRLDWLFCE